MNEETVFSGYFGGGANVYVAVAAQSERRPRDKPPVA